MFNKTSKLALTILLIILELESADPTDALNPLVHLSLRLRSQVVGPITPFVLGPHGE